MLTKKIGGHTIEVSYSSTGTFDPWFLELAMKYNMSLMCTSDIGYFMRIDDDSIFKLLDPVAVDKKVLTWEAMYEAMPEEVENEIGYLKSLPSGTKGIERYPEIYEKRLSINEMLDRWKITGIRALESIEKEDKIDGITLSNARLLFGYLFDRGCYVPDEDGVTGIGNEIIFRFKDYWIDISPESLRTSDGRTLRCDKRDIKDYIVDILKKPRKNSK